MHQYILEDSKNKAGEVTRPRRGIQQIAATEEEEAGVSGRAEVAKGRVQRADLPSGVLLALETPRWSDSAAHMHLFPVAVLLQLP